MNTWNGSGRICKDLELKIGDGGNASLRFSVAVDRTVKRNDQWAHEADFINCVAFGKTAEFIDKYFAKGDFIILLGNIKTGNYTNKDGVIVYTTDIFVEKAEFGGSKKADAGNAQSQQAPSQDGFLNIPDGIDEEIPFS